MGEHSAEVRAASLSGLERFGVIIDNDRNNAPSTGARRISTDDSEVAVLVVPTNEEWQIARETLSLARDSGA